MKEKYHMIISMDAGKKVDKFQHSMIKTQKTKNRRNFLNMIKDNNCYPILHWQF